MGAMEPQASEAGNPQKRQRETVSKPRREAALSSLSELLASQTEREHIVVSGHTVCGPLLQQPQARIWAPNSFPIPLPWEAFQGIPRGPWGQALCQPQAGGQERDTGSSEEVFLT